MQAILAAGNVVDTGAVGSRQHDEARRDTKSIAVMHRSESRPNLDRVTFSLRRLGREAADAFEFNSPPGGLWVLQRHLRLVELSVSHRQA